MAGDFQTPWGRFLMDVFGLLAGITFLIIVFAIIPFYLIYTKIKSWTDKK